MRIRTTLAASIVSVGLALAAGCTIVTSGTITEKEYEESETTTTTVCTSYNQAGTCTKSKRQVKTEPECWELDLENAEGVEGSVCVTEDEYNSYAVGDQYPRSS